MSMKKVLLIDASLRSGFTAKAAANLTELLGEDIRFETLALRESTITQCTGCCLCLSQGSVRCPHRGDGVKEILDRMLESDGVIVMAPNYSLQVPGVLKDLLDRLAYVFHRPRLFGKAFLPVIVQGVYGGGKVAAYLNEVFGFWGMNTAKGAVLTGGIFPRQSQDARAVAKNSKALAKGVAAFRKELYREKPKAPTFFRMMIFRSTRSSMLCFDEALPPDKAYYEEKGWDTADYYYPVPIGPVKRFAGFLVDKMIRRMAG